MQLLKEWTTNGFSHTGSFRTWRILHPQELMTISTWPKIITHSVLDKADILFPETKYFQHIDHWKKPIQFSELATRAAELMGLNFGGRFGQYCDCLL